MKRIAMVLVWVCIAMVAGCATDATLTEVDKVQQSTAADNYAWMVGHWTCDTKFNGYSTAEPQYKSHRITAGYRFTLLEDEPDHLLVHEEYREQTVEPGFDAFDYDADILIDLANPPGPQGRQSSLVGKFTNGDAFSADGTIAGRDAFFLGRYVYHGNITTAIDGATRSWTRVAFAHDPDPSNRPFGDWGDNFRIQLGEPEEGLQKQYLATSCVKDVGHEPPHDAAQMSTPTPGVITDGCADDDPFCVPPDGGGGGDPSGGGGGGGSGGACIGTVSCDPTAGWTADLFCTTSCGHVARCYHTYRCGDDWSCPEAHIGYCM